MEKQTIGQFLSALRRSNGYTQQEVAEKLGVSNKTVSCWERDSSYPDISMIPALAELYGVTCDEILRAKRLPAKEEKPQDDKAQIAAEKAEKEASAVFANMLAKYDNTHKIAVSIAIFTTFLAILISYFVSYLFNNLFASFFVPSIILIATLFALSLVQYRLNFAIPVDKRTLAVRKRIYLRKTRACDFIVLVLVYYLPLTGSYPSFSFYIAYGIACVVITFFIILILQQFRKINHPEFYGVKEKTYINKKIIAFICVFLISLTSVAVFDFCIKRQPLPEKYYGGSKAFVENLENLETRLTHSDLPEKYQFANYVPSVTDQYEEYRYYVKATEYDEDDLYGYINYTVTGNLTDEYFSVYIMYPVWTVKYYEKDPITGDAIEKYKKITVYNSEYSKAFLKSNPDGTFYLSSFDSANTTQLKEYRDREYTLKFGAFIAVLTLIIFCVINMAINEYEKSKNEKYKKKPVCMITPEANKDTTKADGEVSDDDKEK